MRVATWNVNGIRARQGQFLEWVDREQPDVVCVQEVKATPAQVPEAICNLRGYSCYWHGHGGYSGVALHLRSDSFPLPAFSHPPFDNESRIVQAEAGGVVFISVYVPNGGKDYDAKIVFIKEMISWIRELHAGGKSVVLCGDMNVAFTDADVHPKERKADIIGQRPEERELFQRLLAEGLVDVHRRLDPENDRLFTWWPYWRDARKKNVGWRLDYVLASEGLAATATECQVLVEVGTSDHAPVVATFATEGP